MTPETKRLLNIVGGLILVIAIGMAAWGVYVAQTSGVLAVTSSDQNAVITISQTNHQAKVIGTGSAKVHLKAGNYQVGASSSGRQDFTVVHVTTKQTSNVSLNPVSSPQLPSVATIDFEGTDAFIEHGLSSDQVNAIKQAFFNFNPVAKKVAIDTTSLQPGPHNPNTDIGFSTTFKVSIDSTSYKGLVRYTDLSSARLYLYDPATNKQVFDSGNI